MTEDRRHLHNLDDILYIGGRCYDRTDPRLVSLVYGMLNPAKHAEILGNALRRQHLQQIGEEELRLWREAHGKLT